MNENRYMSPGELSLCFEEQGLCLSDRYIRAVRRYAIRIGDNPFVAGMARPTDVLDWLKRHPKFTIRRGESDQDPVGISSL